MSRGSAGDKGSGAAENQRRLALTLVLVVIYMVAEIVGGLLTNSLALLADAGHMLSDAAALGLALFAIWFARRPPTPQHTYGYYRAEILAALINAATLVAVALYIFVAAIRRFASPPEVEGGLMLLIASGGLLVNLIGLWILRGGKDESLNIRGAWLHVLTDMFGSLQAMVAGALIWTLGWDWVDPLASILIGLLVTYSGWDLLKQSVSVLMESAPASIDVDEVRDAIISVPEVDGVHDLHIWTITSGLVALSAHVVTREDVATGPLLQKLRELLEDRFGIGHITIQIEPEGFEEGELVI